LLEVETEAKCIKYGKPKCPIYNIKESGKTDKVLNEVDVVKESVH
jgi:hypothetical protein